MADIGLDDVEELRQFGTYLHLMQNDFTTVDIYADEQGCNKSGFTGVFTVLRPAMDHMADIFTKGINVAKDRLDSTNRGLQAVADRYERMENGGRKRHDDIHIGGN